MTTGLNHGYGGVKVNKKLNVKGFCTDLAYDLVGSVLYAAGIVCFVNPANMAPGGMSGVAILLNYLWGLPIGTVVLVLNIPTAIICYKALGREFMLKSAKSILITSAIMDYVAPLFPLYTGDKILALVCTAVLTGLGCALILMRESFGFYYACSQSEVSVYDTRQNIICHRVHNRSGRYDFGIEADRRIDIWSYD